MFERPIWKPAWRIWRLAVIWLRNCFVDCIEVFIFISSWNLFWSWCSCFICLHRWTKTLVIILFNSRFKIFIEENRENKRESRIPRISWRHQEFITCNWLFCGTFCILLSQLQKVPISAVLKSFMFGIMSPDGLTLQNWRHYCNPP